MNRFILGLDVIRHLRLDWKLAGLSIVWVMLCFGLLSFSLPWCWAVVGTIGVGLLVMIWAIGDRWARLHPEPAEPAEPAEPGRKRIG